MKPTLPPCPRCNRRQSVVAQGELFWCTNCRGLFDDQPDEGGSHYDDPSKRLEKQEARRVQPQRRRY